LAAIGMVPAMTWYAEQALPAVRKYGLMGNILKTIECDIFPAPYGVTFTHL